MKLKAKKIIVLFMVTTLFLSNSFTVYASSGSPNDNLSEARIIALNTPAIFGYYYDWQILQETFLYGTNNELTAYCFDMKCNESLSPNCITSYAIINADTKGFPVLLFGFDGTSAYLNQDCEKAYYFGLLNCFLLNDSIYTDARTHEVLNLPQINAFFNTPMPSSSDEANTYSSIRAAYINGMTPLTTPDVGNITNAGVTSYNLQWRKGCVPTSVAMMIKSKYSSLNSDALIDSLALYMETTSNGGTTLSNVENGINTYFEKHPSLTTPTVCRWNSTNIWGVINYGLTYNSKADFKVSINAGFPVGVHCASSNITTSGYPEGIGAHMLCGIGYNYSSAGDYIICYTTNVADGQVSFPLTSAGLNNHAWFLLKW